MTDTPASSQNEPLDLIKQETAAIERIAATYDGALLHRRLRRELERVDSDTSHGTLAQNQGRRSLARDIMLVMAKAIEANGERQDSILRNPSGPVRLGASGIARRGGPVRDGEWGTGGSAVDPIGPSPDAA